MINVVYSSDSHLFYYFARECVQIRFFFRNVVLITLSLIVLNCLRKLS